MSTEPSYDVPLSEYLSLLKFYSDQIHKFWGYFQIISVGVVTFVWSKDASTGAPHSVIAVAYFLFAIANASLLFSTQGAARETWENADKLLSKCHSSSAFKSSLGKGRPMKAGIVFAGHLAMIVGVVAAILLK